MDKWSYNNANVAGVQNQDEFCLSMVNANYFHFDDHENTGVVS